MPEVPVESTAWTALAHDAFVPQTCPWIEHEAREIRVSCCRWSWLRLSALRLDGLRHRNRSLQPLFLLLLLLLIAYPPCLVWCSGLACRASLDVPSCDVFWCDVNEHVNEPGVGFVADPPVVTTSVRDPGALVPRAHHHRRCRWHRFSGAAYVRHFVCNF